MYLKCSTRNKDGKEHRSWSIVESRRYGQKVSQRHVLYLGEINDSQKAAWEKTISVFDETQGQEQQVALFSTSIGKSTSVGCLLDGGWALEGVGIGGIFLSSTGSES